MSLDREEMIDDIARSSHEIWRAASALATFEWLGLDLSMAQLKTLLALAGRGPLSVGTLAQMLGVQLPAASHAVRGLVQLGLARRLKDENDLRCTYIQLTPHAEELVDQLRQGRREIFHGWLAELTDEELAAAQRGLQAIAAATARKQLTWPGTAGGAATPDGCDGPASPEPCALIEITDLTEELS